MPLAKRKVVCDIEANGLDPDIIWCIVCIDYDTGETFTFKLDEVYTEFPKFATTVQTWVGHNFIGYDAWAINNLIPNVNIKVSDIDDTLVMSRLFEPDRLGGHSLDAWGGKLNYPKTDFNDFDNYSDEMLKYCINDTQLTVKIYQALLQEGRNFNDQSIRLEHNVTYILREQTNHGFYLDRDRAQKLHDYLYAHATKLEADIQAAFPPVKKYTKVNWKPRLTANGQMHGADAKSLARWEHDRNPDGTYNRYVWQHFNLDSPKQVVERMTEAGWRPIERTKSYAEWSKKLQYRQVTREEFNQATAMMWKVNETNLETLPDTAPEAAKNIAEYKVASTRYKVVAEWLAQSEKDSRVHGQVNSCGAYTHRMSHFNPNMANIPRRATAKWAHECRECLTVPKGFKLLGCDASGIQLRMLAHYMDDEEYVDAILHGDIHTKNQEAAGIDTRDNAKTFIYAWVLGAGDAKIGSIVGGTPAEGRALKERFLDSLPKLRKLKEEVIPRLAKQGYMVGLDGRRLRIPSEHLALGVHLQGGEAVVMKAAKVLWWQRAIKAGMKPRVDFCPVANVHDEWQTEVREELAEQLGEIQRQSIVDAGRLLGVRCPLDGEYRIGNNWAETH